MGIDDWVKATSSLVAVVASIVALVVSMLNAANYYADRDARSKQESFQNQLGIARIYFERLADDFCSKKAEALLLVQITDYSARDLGSATTPSGSPHPIAGLAQLMRGDFEKRSCSSDARVGESAPDTSGVATVQQAQLGTTYSVKEVAGRTITSAPTAPANSYTVYIQYKADAAKAREVQAAINRDAQFVAPGIDQVAEVPSRNEIRIYKDSPDDRAAAQALQSAFVPDARIVSLAKAYPNLKTRTMEVWLKD